MYARVVRFTDVAPDHMDALLARVESGGPPEGMPIKGIQILVDQAQRTAVVVQLFETAEDMRVGGEMFAAMDASETPGTRVSVDACEIKLERHLE